MTAAASTLCAMYLGRRVRDAAAVIVVAAAALCADAAAARSRAHDTAEMAAIALPAEAREVLSRVRRGGPFQFERDGVAFANRERQLPAQPLGYYHEYTVPTPGAPDRGARRIVCGGARTAPKACYYTGDHYRTFRRIRE